MVTFTGCPLSLVTFTGYHVRCTPDPQTDLTREDVTTEDPTEGHIPDPDQDPEVVVNIPLTKTTAALSHHTVRGLCK